MAEVNLRKVIKKYDEVEAVRGIDLDIADHEFVVLVGNVEIDALDGGRLLECLDDVAERHLGHVRQPFVAPAVSPAM